MALCMRRSDMYEDRRCRCVHSTLSFSLLQLECINKSSCSFSIVEAFSARVRKAGSKRYMYVDGKENRARPDSEKQRPAIFASSFFFVRCYRVVSSTDVADVALSFCLTNVCRSGLRQHQSIPHIKREAKPCSLQPAYFVREDRSSCDSVSLRVFITSKQ